MLKDASSLVTLPNGEIVHRSSTPEPWWSEHNANGYVDPHLLAPDPDQPRRRMNKTKLAELELSITTCGVHEPITVTPRARAPWVKLLPEHKHLPFVIVSGHRRTTIATRANIAAVPIRIRIFSNEEDHRTSGGVLNTCRENLSELEEGFEFARERKAGKSLKAIGDAHGHMNPVTVQNRINLTKLHRDLFPLLDPDPNTGKRPLPIYPASILGGIDIPSEKELEDASEQFGDVVDVRKATGHRSFEGLTDDERRFAMQKLLVAVIVVRKLNSVRAAEFIRDRTLVFESSSGRNIKTERYQPARRKEVLLNLANATTGSAIVDWTPEEFRRIYAHSPREEVEDVLRKLQDALDVLSGTMKLIEGIRDSKHATSPEVQALMNRVTKGNHGAKAS